MIILFLTKDLRTYSAAMYQNDLLEELKRQSIVFVYGPGYPEYIKGLNINKVFDLFDVEFDLVLVGHFWLSDSLNEDINPDVGLSLVDCKVPKAVILNKEYVRLEEKLQWIKSNNFQMGFSHHHEVDLYQNISGVKFEFLPFAVNKRKIINTNYGKKKYDLSFSGILQNQNKKSNQSDIRIRLMNDIFISVLDIPLIQKKKYSDLSIFWNTIPRRSIALKIAYLLGKWRRLDDHEYFNMQMQSILFVNSPSPLGIISPRIFENMACRTIPFCSYSKTYERIFKKDSLVYYKEDLSDFGEKLRFILENKKLRKEIVDRNYNFVMENHTWEIRIEELLNILETIR